MNFNLVEMYNGLLRFNKHILNELAEGLKHLPNLDGVSKGDSLIINEQGNPAWGSAAFIKTMTRTREDGKEEVFSACIKPDDTRYLGGNKGVNHADVTKDNVNEKCYLIGCQANTNNFITEFDFQRGVYFIPNKVGSNKKADYNWKRGNDGQDTDKVIRVLLLGGSANHGSQAGSGDFDSVGFFTTVKLD